MSCHPIVALACSRYINVSASWEQPWLGSAWHWGGLSRNVLAHGRPCYRGIPEPCSSVDVRVNELACHLDPAARPSWPRPPTPFDPLSEPAPWCRVTLATTSS